MSKKEFKTIREGRKGRVKVAHVQITTYKEQPKDVREYFPERKIVRDAVVVQIGRKMRNGEWDNSNQLWMSTDEFCKLGDAIDDFMDEEEGDNSSSDSSDVKSERGDEK